MEVLYLAFAFFLFIFAVYSYTKLMIANKRLKEQIAKLEMENIRLKGKFQ